MYLIAKISLGLSPHCLAQTLLMFVWPQIFSNCLCATLANTLIVRGRDNDFGELLIVGMPWNKFESSSRPGHYYYFNSDTNESTWTKPDEWRQRSTLEVTSHNHNYTSSKFCRRNRLVAHFLLNNYPVWVGWVSRLEGVKGSGAYGYLKLLYASVSLPYLSDVRMHRLSKRSACN